RETFARGGRLHLPVRIPARRVALPPAGRTPRRHARQTDGTAATNTPGTPGPLRSRLQKPASDPGASALRGRSSARTWPSGEPEPETYRFRNSTTWFTLTG